MNQDSRLEKDVIDVGEEATSIARIAKETLERSKSRQSELEAKAPKCPYCEIENVAVSHGVYCSTCGSSDCLTEEYISDDAEKMKRRSKNVSEFLVGQGVGSRYSNAKIEDFPSAIQKVFASAHTDSSFFLVGPNGVGKSHLAAAIMAKHFIDYDSTDQSWQNVPSLLGNIRRSFRDNSALDEGEIIQRLSNCRILVLDDLGAEKETEYSIQTLYTIINNRYENNRATIVTTNSELSSIEKTSPRIASRLSSYDRVLLKGRDRRIEE